MFERYTERARRTLFFARYEASQLGSLSIEAEHLLLGLFTRTNLTLDEIRQQIQARAGRRAFVPTSVEMPFARDTDSTTSTCPERCTASTSYVRPFRRTSR